MKKTGFARVPALALVLAMALFVTACQADTGQNSVLSASDSKADTILQGASADSESATATDTPAAAKKIEKTLSKTLNLGFQDCNEVVYESDSHTYFIRVWQAGLAAGVVEVKEGKVDISEWDAFKKALLEMAAAVKKKIGEAGSGAHVNLSVLNDEKTEESLLTILDDVVVYDAVTETE